MPLNVGVLTIRTGLDNKEPQNSIGNDQGTYINDFNDHCCSHYRSRAIVTSIAAAAILLQAILPTPWLLRTPL